jgi:hypothetical protein
MIILFTTNSIEMDSDQIPLCGVYIGTDNVKRIIEAEEFM